MKSLLVYLLVEIINYRFRRSDLSEHLISWFSSPDAKKLIYEKHFLKYVSQHPDWLWNLSIISKNPNLTMKFVENHRNISWDWDEIC